MTQSVLAVSLLSSLAVLGTTTFILMRQQLYLRRDRPKLSEQVVVTNIATTLIVFLGMATTYGLLGITNVCIGLALFPPAVVREWAASVPGDIGVSHHLILSAFVASLGVCLGALGASFEHQQYFRHIALVDEEI